MYGFTLTKHQGIPKGFAGQQILRLKLEKRS